VASLGGYVEIAASERKCPLAIIAMSALHCRLALTLSRSGPPFRAGMINSSSLPLHRRRPNFYMSLASKRNGLLDVTMKGRSSTLSASHSLLWARESETTRLEEAAAAYRAALEELTRERVTGRIRNRACRPAD